MFGLSSDLFFVRDVAGVKEGLHGRLSEAVSSLVCTVVVVVLHPGIEIRLERLYAVVDLTAEGDAVELVEHGFVKALDDTVGLRTARPGAGMADIFNHQV